LGGVVVGVRVKMYRTGMLDTWKSDGIYYPGEGGDVSTQHRIAQKGLQKKLTL
jgi:hypothetical protein